MRSFWTRPTRLRSPHPMTGFTGVPWRLPRTWRRPPPLRERLDKEWGLTDRVSIVVMRDRGLSDALTTDEHFCQAGFRPLLRDDLP